MDKKQLYGEILSEINALITDENDLYANLANISAAIHHKFNFWWTGFYLVKNNQLVLGPFQGPVACTRIDFGKGVCGASWKEKKSIVVPDVHHFPGHIACSAASNSEIVVPVIKNNEVIMVLDIDSILFNNFDDTDRIYLEELAKMISDKTECPLVI